MILLAVFVTVALIGSFVGSKIRDSRLSYINRVLGLFAGMFKGLLLAVMLVYILVFMMPKNAQLLQKSFTVPYVVSAGHLMVNAFPAKMSDSFKEKLRAIEKQPPGVQRLKKQIF
jgi:uncharacterized membrane protein required for colicin V production